ncbi:MAG TPA: IPT/TIG domain-containing protein, partial [Actinomycetota bacterium]|nr:IPT/TIG domain-containing protein [Actinomycetota bacterium]
MKAGRLPPRLSACLALAGLLVGLVAVPSALADGAPTVSSFTPTCGPVGTSVDVNGNNFQDATHVTFNGVEATFSVQSGHLINSTVPTGATTGKIGVVSPQGTDTSSADFTVSSSCAAAPTISSFSPTSGPVGTSVTINGTGFTGATAVTFGGVSAGTFSVNGAGTRITAIVPSGAVTGKITVTTPGGTATSSTNFTVTGAAAPTISSFSPTSGPVGTSVRINGSGFGGATAVRFNGVAAASFT